MTSTPSPHLFKRYEQSLEQTFADLAALFLRLRDRRVELPRRKLLVE